MLDLTKSRNLPEGDPAVMPVAAPATAMIVADTAPGDALAPTPLEDAERLSRHMKNLLDGAETAQLKSDVKSHIDSLNAWIETYRAGVDAAQKLADTGLDTLKEAQSELSATLEQYLRLEDEGGPAATPEQARRTEDIARTLKHVHKLIGAVELTFAGGKEDIPESPPPADEPEITPSPAPETNPDLQPDIPPVETPSIGRS